MYVVKKPRVVLSLRMEETLVGGSHYLHVNSFKCARSAFKSDHLFIFGSSRSYILHSFAFEKEESPG
jgi:hypothetical protein